MCKLYFFLRRTRFRSSLIDWSSPKAKKARAPWRGSKPSSVLARLHAKNTPLLNRTAQARTAPVQAKVKVTEAVMRIMLLSLLVLMPFPACAGALC